MTGATEILVLIFLILSILILPRLLKPVPNKKPLKGAGLRRLGILPRVGIAVSLIYPMGAALIIKPWQLSNWVEFAGLGVMPVVIGWALVWILQGYKK